MIVCVKNTFERRLGIWPTGFDADGTMWCNTAFGDYPHYIPATRSDLTNTKKIYSGVTPISLRGGGNEIFTGWMLLNYKTPIQVSSTLGAYNANYAVDENIKTWWSAATGNKGEWIQTDLGKLSTVNAVQINYADQDVADDRLGKRTDQFHQYKLYYSADGKKWNILVDKSNNKTDVPHEYVELEKPVQARYIKLENIHMPTGKFAISGLRVFGNGNGAKPDAVKQLIVLRTEKDKRSAYIKWSPVNNAYAYNIYYGTHPDKLYNCVMVHDFNEYWFKAMDSQKAYYFTIEAINENGISARSKLMKAE
jgi:xylan 1,4-beta-xylosidase